jgi:hypothetical protein
VNKYTATYAGVVCDSNGSAAKSFIATLPLVEPLKVNTMSRAAVPWDRLGPKLYMVRRMVVSQEATICV